jgi:hypothetical protein
MRRCHRRFWGLRFAVRECDQDKLAFFSPDNEKWTWKVMPFGRRNAPGFHTYLIHVLSIEWVPYSKQHCVLGDVDWTSPI